MSLKKSGRTLFVLAALAPAAAIGAQATGTLSVSATVLTSCTVTPLPLLFGNYTPASGDATATTTITVLCTLGTPYNVRLGSGQNSVDVAARKMLVGGGGTDTLNYELYRDASHTQNWGETDTTDTVDSTGTGLLEVHTVYGVIPGEQFVSAGVYTDSVTITVDY